MGTNYYRIPTEEEILKRQKKLIKSVQELDVSIRNISEGFRDIDDGKSDFDWSKKSAWEEFVDEMQIHVGKNSSGWKFLFNHNDWKYYKNIKELKEFINSGRLVDEYGEKADVEEFWKFIEKKQKDSEMIYSKQYYEDGIGSEDSWSREYARKNGYYEEVIENYRFSTSTSFS